MLFMMSPGRAEAAETCASGDIYFVTFGRTSGEVFRDSVTGIRFQSLGCVIREGDLEYQEDWNSFMAEIWNDLSSLETFFVLRTDSESIEYREGSCVYRDLWGSVPVEIYPEDLSHVAWLLNRNIREEADRYGVLEMYVPSWEDTLFSTVSVDSEKIRDLFQRGRDAIRVNTVN